MKSMLAIDVDNPVDNFVDPVDQIWIACSPTHQYQSISKFWRRAYLDFANFTIGLKIESNKSIKCRTFTFFHSFFQLFRKPGKKLVRECIFHFHFFASSGDLRKRSHS